MSGNVAESIVQLEREPALDAIRERAAAGEDPLALVEECRAGMVQVGQRFQEGEYYLSERGAFGDVDDAYEADLHVGYPLKLGDKFEVNLLLDVFNLLDAQTEILRENRYTIADEPNAFGTVIDWNTGQEFAPITPSTGAGNPQGAIQTSSFNTARAWTSPRRVRFGVRLSW